MNEKGQLESIDLREGENGSGGFIVRVFHCIGSMVSVYFMSFRNYLKLRNKVTSVSFWTALILEPEDKC